MQIKKYLLSLILLTSSFVLIGCSGTDATGTQTESAYGGVTVQSTPILIPFSGSVPENTVAGTVIGSIIISNSGNVPITTLTLSGVGSEKFTLGVNGAITVADEAILDFETISSYTLSASGLDGNNNAIATVDVIINITDVVETVSISAFTGSVPEGSGAGTIIGKVDITGDTQSPITQIALTGIGSENFTVGLDGTISVVAGALLDYETISKYTLIANGTDSNNNPVPPASLTIMVTNETESPLLSSFIGSVSEDIADKSVIGKIDIIGSETTISSIKLEGTGAENFTLVLDGTISVAVGADIDYETVPQYNLSVTGVDSKGNNLSVSSVIIDVTNIIESPMMSPLSLNILENIAEYKDIGQVIISGNESTIKKMVLTGAGSDNFDIKLDGTISIALGALFDVDKLTDYNLTVSAIDSEAQNLVPQPVNIKILEAIISIDVPTLEDSIGNVDENAQAGATAGSLVITSIGDSIISKITLSGTGSENFTILNNGNIFVAEGANIDYDTSKGYTLTAVATNSAGDSNSVIMTIYVNNISEELVTIGVSSGNVAENANSGTLVGNIDIISTGDTEMTALRLDGTGSTNFVVALDGKVTVSPTAVLDYESVESYSLSIIATNGKGESLPVAMNISVTNIEDNAPFLSTPTAITIPEDETIGNTISTITTIGGTPIDINSVTGYEITSGNGDKVFSIDNTGAVKVAKALDWESITSYTLGITATNSFSSSVEVSLDISITNVVDEKPVLASPSSITVEENTTSSVVISTITTNGLTADQNRVMTYSIIDGNSANKFTINNSGEVTIATPLDYETTPNIYNLTISASNEAGASIINVTLLITVTNSIDNNPIIADANPNSVNIDESISIGTVISNISTAGSTTDENTVTSYTIGGDDGNFTVSDTGVVATSGNLDYETKDTYTLSITGHNANGPSNTVSILVSVGNIIEVAPILDTTTDTNVKPDSAIGTVIYTITTDGSSIDSDTVDNYTILSGNGSGDFNISNTGEIKIVNELIGNSDYTFTIKATNASNIDSNIVTLNIHIYKAPIAIVRYTQSELNASALGQMVYIESISVAGDNPITNYQWKEGSTLLSSDENISTTASGLGVGSHNIILTIQDSVGLESNTSIIINIYQTPIKKSMQTDSYDGLGSIKTDGSMLDDGYYQLGLDSNYTRGTDNIVTDHLTGRMWQDDGSLSANYTFDQADGNCSALSLGIYDDWRLPTRAELVNIIDFSKNTQAIDSKFINITSSYYWTSSSHASSRHSVVYFDDGTVFNYPDTSLTRVKCIR